jgi:hypothetical protein
MSGLADSWESRVLNLEALGEGEKKLWLQIEPILNELLDELKAKGKIEVSFVKSEKDQLKNVLDNLHQVSVTNNTLIHLFEKTQNCQDFLKYNSKFGFDDKQMVSLYLQSSILL